jgi:hypothetical protein
MELLARGCSGVPINGEENLCTRLHSFAGYPTDGCPTPNPFRHKACRQQALRKDGEAYFLSGGEAVRRVKHGSLDAPVFTEGQQRCQ